MGDIFPKFRAAAVQAAPVYLDREKTLQKTVTLVEEAASQGANLIVFPESFIPGYPYFIWLGTPITMPQQHEKLFRQWFLNGVEIPSVTTDALCAAARKHNTYLVVGINERDGNTCYNTLLFIDRKGSILGKHRKLMPTCEERTVWGRGDGSDLVVFDTDLGKVSGLICWEHTMNLVRHALYTMGEQIHCAVWVGFSNVRGWEEQFNMGTELSARYHAHVGECFVINVQNTSDEATRQILCATDEQKELFKVGGGWTAIIAPGGEVLAGPLKDKEGILYADLDLDLIVDWARWHDAVGHYARNDVVSLVINREKYSAAKEIGVQYTPSVRKPRLEGLQRSFQCLKAKIEAGKIEELKKLAQELEVELSKASASGWSLESPAVHDDQGK